jgi:hypothetical protein
MTELSGEEQRFQQGLPPFDIEPEDIKGYTFVEF